MIHIQYWHNSFLLVSPNLKRNQKTIWVLLKAKKQAHKKKKNCYIIEKNKNEQTKAKKLLYKNFMFQKNN